MSPTYLYSSLVVSILVAQSAAQGEYDPNDIEALNAAGAAGKSGGGGMSTGGMIALCVIVGVVVILGFSSAALFYIAKKRQWAMREALRRSAKQVVRAVKTPLTPRFPRSQRPLTPDGDSDAADRSAPRVKPARKPTDVEKDAVITSNEASKSSETKPRGWSSYFSFNRS
ncbi:hypothetical protein AN7532.2 [Aspergillus nidulans FGSC A4]|uniref:Transmembrane protein n=1 Tax=Emericella nidulans (strain FGSC A4 / ATCC 38163 / CBS 112.46 / NRRL 194 / M139) TaxID=227321 RepID=Q5AVZ8_EMENI|nr:hypothetical protein [Aspergillus nidulans FGSC A4]EAA62112.1 hypothetical protein AN7532.2 [Aspergillus nidulans FGSC A4]CBF79581.1 TPA: hypothetical protein ANIA_07532 [Aspergillus nidulans FGSC A4]|eukprot:XP_680801.1 hypothetical protein AN7532.2 [Aspergillus nidulans FGSC A4]